jgi:hypothetical protein
MKSVGITKQLAALVIAFALVALLSAAGLSVQLSRSSARSQELTSGINAMNETLFGLVGAVSDVQLTTQRLVRDRDPDAIEKLMQSEQSSRQTAEKRITQGGAEAARVEEAFRKLDQTNRRVVETLLRGENAMAQQMLIEESNPAFDALLHEILEAAREQAKQSQERLRETAEQSALAQRAVVALSIIGVGVLTAFAAFMVRRVNRSLNRATFELSESANQMASASAQVSDSSTALAQGAAEQAASLEETSASTEEISSITRKNADNSKAAACIMDEAARVVDDANQKLELMVVSMSEIRGSGEKISKIIRVIEEIAFQTNILALNAAVEAARAGESGMGFAVVADEVRSLAQRCARAAQDTTSLIEESIRSAGVGASRVDTVVQSVDCLIKNTRKAKTLVDEVNHATQEQARGMESIAGTVVQMEKVTQQNAASAEQSAAASEQLRAQAESLRGVVAELHTLIRGR